MQPIFIVLADVRRDHVRQRLLLRAVHSGLEGSTGGVDVIYREDEDRALVILRVDDALAERQRSWMSEALAGAGVEVFPEGRAPDATWDGGPALRGLPTPDAALRALARRIGLLTSPPDLAANEAIEPVRVDFRRGDVWRTGRICSLSREGMFVATPAMPRRGERLEVVLGQGSREARVGAEVTSVVPIETAPDVGAAGFAARFIVPEDDGPARDALAAICASVCGVVTLAQPPRRRELRVPLRWPVRLDVDGVHIDGTALDVSRRGVFVATVAQVAAQFAVAVPLDDGAVLVEAQVMRAITPQMSRERGLPAGYGLELIPGAGDEERFEEFVGRVARRASAQVIVAAEGARRVEIVKELASIGYSPWGAGAIPELIDRAERERPDVVIVDASVWRHDPRELDVVRRALRTQGVALVELGGKPAVYARLMCDAVLRGQGLPS
jgi:hypothetical protein